MGRVVKKAVHVDNSLVLNAALDPQLQRKLIHHHVGLNHAFRNFFKSKYTSRSYVPSKVNTAKLALSQLATYLKLIDQAAPSEARRWTSSATGG